MARFARAKQRAAALAAAEHLFPGRRSRLAGLAPLADYDAARARGLEPPRARPTRSGPRAAQRRARALGPLANGARGGGTGRTTDVRARVEQLCSAGNPPSAGLPGRTLAGFHRAPESRGRLGRRHSYGGRAPAGVVVPATRRNPLATNSGNHKRGPGETATRAPGVRS